MILKDFKADQRIISKSGVFALDSSSSKDLFAIGCLDGSINLYEEKDRTSDEFNYQHVKSFNLEAGSADEIASCTAVIFNSNSDQIYAGGSNGIIKAFCTENESVLEFSCKSAISFLLLDEARSSVIAGTEEGQVCIFDERTKNITNSIDKEFRSSITGLEMISKNIFCCSTEEGLMSLIDLRKFEIALHSDQYEDSINCLKKTIDKNLLLLGSDTGNVYAFKKTSLEACLKEKEEDIVFDYDDKFSTSFESIDNLLVYDDNTLIVSSFDGVLRLMKLSEVSESSLELKTLVDIDSTKEHDNMPIEHMAMNNANNRLISISHDKTIRVFNFKKDEIISRSEDAIEEESHKRFKTDDESFYDDM